MKYKQKVNFLIVGAQKSGTTALDSYLRKHPSICMASQKEVHFFDTEKYFGIENVDYNFYHQFFNPTFEKQLLGEATPIYMYWNSSIPRIYEYNPDMKIILVLRNPIERAFSHWNMERDRNKDSLPFFDAIFNEIERCKEAFPQQHRVYSYIDRGFYTKQIKRIMDYFPNEQILILKYDTLKNNSQETMNEVFKFLGVSSIEIEFEDVHSRQYVIQMSKKEKDFLKNIFEDEIKNLEYLLGWNCSDWLTEGKA